MTSTQNQHPDPYWLNIGQAADRLHVSRWIVSKMVKDGQLPTTVLHRRPMVRTADVERLLAEAER